LELLGAMELDARVLELHFEIGNGALEAGIVGFGGVHALRASDRRGWRAIAFADVRAFVKKDTSDAPGEFGGDGSARRGVT